MVRDPAGVVVSARRMMEHHPDNSSLWWMCAHAVTSMEPTGRNPRVRSSAEYRCDICDVASRVTYRRNGVYGGMVRTSCRTQSYVEAMCVCWSLIHSVKAKTHFVCSHAAVSTLNSSHLKELRQQWSASDVTIVTAKATSRDGVLCAGGALPLVALARLLDRPSWLVAPEGVHLAPSLWQAMKEDLCGRPDSWASGYDVMEWAHVSHIVDGTGIVDVERYLARVSCPDAPELLRRSAI